MTKSHQPFHQKYRPKSLDELIGQEVISLTLKQALSTQRIVPAYLFCGPRGTGKTSSARIFAKSLNCQSYDKPTPSPCNKCDLCRDITIGNALDVVEIDAASNTGVENVREIIERANFAPAQARWKVYVIDECHMLSTAASNALLKTIEEPPQKVIFILATTNPERVIKTIQSRCQKFDFKRINSNDIYSHLIEIAKKESIEYENSAIKLIAKRSNGGMRDAQSLLEQLSLIPTGIKKINVEEILGEVSEYDLINLINSLIKNDPNLLITSCSELYDAGNEPIAILEGLLNITRDLLLKTTTDEYSELFHTSNDFYSELDRFAQLVKKERIIEWHRQLRNLEYQIKNSNQPRLWLEINLSSLLNIGKIIKENENIKELHGKAPNNLNISQQQIEEKKIDKNIIKFEEKKINSNVKDEINDIESINLKEKWSLILSKVELPSTRMLLSQQAELLSIQSNHIEICLSPNWENMIKSRKIVIENAVKKIFGEHMAVNFTGKKNLIISKSTAKQTSDISKDQIIKDINKKTSFKGDNIVEKNSSKNLADFFNGEIIDKFD